MNVIFLDIDGVLISGRSAKVHGFRTFSPPHVAIFNHVLRSVHLDMLVLSSAWRVRCNTDDDVRELLTSQGVVIPVGVDVDRTCGGEGMNAVSRWLEDHPDTRLFAIVEDSTPYLHRWPENTFKCDYQIGLTEDIADRIVSYFTN